MHTLQLNIHDSVYEHFINYLGKFKNNEIKIVSESPEPQFVDHNFSANQKYLKQALEDAENGKNPSYTMEEFEVMMDKVLAKYEN